MLSGEEVARRKVSVLALVAVLVWLCAQWVMRRHFVPGVWVGDRGWLFVDLLWEVLAVCLFGVCLVGFALQRRFVQGAIWLVILVVPFVVQWPIGDWSFRWRSERLSYVRAVQDGAAFGDEHSEVVDGRLLTYWRWKSWGIDNAVGVLHDPEDRLALKEPAFKSVTGGVVWKLVRIEPGWYYVEHS